MTRGTLVRLSTLMVGAALVLLGSPAPLGAQGQATTGIIRGIVTDPNGAPVSGAAVTVRDVQTNFTRTLTTDQKGVFVASLLPLGIYDVVAKAVGFSQATRTGIPVRVGETVDLRLALAAVQLAPVVVEAKENVVEASTVSLSDRLPAAAVVSLPNNGRNFLNLTLLTPDVGIVQGPDGDELTVAGQRGIHNNISVDGADFNNPFFGEQRGGQRPPFTFNLDAVQEIVVTASGATAEFGRSSSGFVNVITKSGTNQVKGSVHYFGKYDWLSADLAHDAQTLAPDFRQHQFGFTLGGPLKQDKAFFFVAYDQQVYDDIKQKTRPPSGALTSLNTYLGTAFGGALASDFGAISRTNDARAALAKLDWRVSDRTNLSLKYNYTWSEQENGTFDVDTWGRSANGLEKDWSNAVNGSLVSFLSSRVSNELRFQWSREDRPRPYGGPVNPVSGRPFPDTGMDFGNAFRFGMPFFLPIKDHDTRVQVLDNISYAKGDHFFKAGAEWNRTETDQTFIGFANGRFIFDGVAGFEGFVANGSRYVECFNDTTGVFTGTDNNATCPAGRHIGGPVLLYLQQAGVGGLSVEQAGTQSIVQNELALYLLDTWKPSAKLTVDYGVRWEAQIEPDPITPPSQVFFQPFLGTTKTTGRGSFAFPSDGTIPSDWKMFQPRFGFTYAPDASGRQVLRGNAGLYFARIPGLNLASARSTNGSIGQTLFGSSATIPFGLGPPAYSSLLPGGGAPFRPDVYVYDKDFQNPRTFSATLGYEREVASDLAVSVSYTHARTDHLTRFYNSNDVVFRNDTLGPWSTGLPAVAGSPTGPADTVNGIGTLWTVKSNARSRYNAITVGIKRLLDPNFQFELNYTLAFDKSDDDNERDPFTLRYASATDLAPEYNWSDRDQRHRFNGWALVRLPGDIHLDNRVSYYSAQPTSASCGPRLGNPFAPPAGERATGPADRICASGAILTRNTLRKDNRFFSWDLRVSRPFNFGRQGQAELLVEVFNLLNTDNFRDPSYGNLLFNFDGTIRSGLGDPRQLQAGVRWVF
ncbi:MAG TPA: TonB-dependent receptor [Gemmatimonadales bacterium]|nr:TonB-dependent receptor [Gemmatimonadales bacterium]